MKKNIETIYKDYSLAKPENNSLYLPFVYQCKLPAIGSPEYYKTLALLKFLEQQGKFNPDNLTMFA